MDRAAVWSLFQLLVLRELMLHRARSFLTALGVAIGAAVVVAVLALNASVLGGFQGMVNTLAGGADLQVRGGQGGVPADLAEKAAGVAGVEAVGAFLEGWVMDPTTGERILLVGVDFLAEEPAPGLIEKGALNENALATLVEDPFRFLNSTDSVLFNENYASRLPIRRGESRRYVTPSGPKVLKVAGVLPESAASRALGGAVAIMTVDAAQLLLHKPDRVDVINLRLKPGADRDTVRHAAQATLGPAYTVEAPERRGQRLARMMLTLTTVMRMISVVAVLVGLFIVQNTLTTAVLQRRREIAIQRALGASRRASRLLVVLEAAILSVMGTLLGIPAGLLLANGALGIVTESISTLYTEVRPTAPQVGALALTLVAVGSVVAACVAAFRPAQRATEVQPATALAGRSHDAAPVSGQSVSASLASTAALALLAAVAARLPQPGAEPWWGYVACFAVLGAGAAAAQAVLVGVQRVVVPLANRFSLSLRLGADGLTRDGSRGAKTAAALMLGLSLYIGVNGAVQSVKRTMLDWVDLAVPADLSVLEGSSLPDARAVPMDPQVATTLAADPGVERVVFQRFRNLDVGDQVTKVQAMDMEGYLLRARLPVVEQVGPVVAGPLAEGEVLISEGMSNLMGLHAGGTLVLPTPSGPHRFPIRAVVVDYSSEVGSVFMDWKVYARLFNDPMVDSFNLYLRPGADAEDVRTRLLARFGQDLGVRVVTHKAFRQFVEDIIDDAFAATRALQLVAVMIALMGIINTLLAAVMDRLREIGVMRAVGATRGQVVRILTTEAMLLGVASAILAAAVGTGFGYVFTEAVADFTTGWRLPFHLPVRAMVESFFLAIGVAAAAAALPARRGSRVDIIAATRGE